jgi:hypothetical protein
LNGGDFRDNNFSTLSMAGFLPSTVATRGKNKVFLGHEFVVITDIRQMHPSSE